MSKNINSLLRWYQDNGCEYLFAEKSSDLLSDVVAPPPIAPKAKLEAVEVQQARQLSDKCNNLSDLIEVIKSFEGCAIKKSATNTVIGDGDVNAKVMFIGEAPGANEDKEGIPFCGQSGKLLNNIIRAMGLDRGSVYITNTVFWRPPGNRRPTPQEIAICRPFVERHIALIKPELIILVGSTAVESLLAVDHSISELRQREFPYNNIYLTSPVRTAVIYHPSYLLRQPYKKKEMWQDLQYIQHHFFRAQ